MASKKSKRSLWDMKIVRRASWDSLVKLHPVTMMKNPVMFVVEAGSVVTSVLLILERMHGQPGFGFNLQITLWLWFTVLYANFAEAMAEGRGKAQADALRRAKAETMANRLLPDGKSRNRLPVPNFAAETSCLVEAGEFVPGDSEIVGGVRLG